MSRLPRSFDLGLSASAPGASPPVDLISDNANDMQHDAVLDYYGRRLATCSSDKTIKIFEVENESHRLVETLKGYTAIPPSPTFPSTN